MKSNRNSNLKIEFGFRGIWVKNPGLAGKICCDYVEFEKFF